MSSSYKYSINHSVLRKVVMSLTGLFLTIFLVQHLIGNLFLLLDDGGQKFNEYAMFMSGNLVIRTVEIVLFASILIHVILSIYLTYRNKSARQTSYVMNRPQPNSTWMSRNMGILGVILFIFLVIHLANFFVAARFGDLEMVELSGGVTGKNLYARVIESFSQLWYVTLYVVCMVALGLHLAHGFQSGFQSLGLNHPKYTPIIKYTGIIFFGIIIPAGFAFIPIYIYLNQ